MGNPRQLSARERWLLKHVAGATIVDIGFAGQKAQLPAYFSQLSRLQAGHRLVVGIDYNWQAVVARRQANSVVGDARALPLQEGSTDCVILGEFLEHHVDITEFIAECHRVLRSNGRLLITTPNPFFAARWLKHWLWPRSSRMISRANVSAAMGHDDHKSIWDPLTLCRMLSRTGFAITELTTLGLWIPWLGSLIPLLRRGLYINVWPLNRLGYITCIQASKLPGGIPS